MDKEKYPGFWWRSGPGNHRGTVRWICQRKLSARLSARQGFVSGGHCRKRIDGTGKSFDSHENAGCCGKTGNSAGQKTERKTIQELRALPAKTIQATFGFYAPIADGYVMPASVAEIYKQSLQTHIPFLTGWNAGEGFLMGIKKKTDFAKEAKEYGPDSAAFSKYFPSETDAQALASQIELSVDKTIGVPQYAWAIKQNENRIIRKGILCSF